MNVAPRISIDGNAYAEAVRDFFAARDRIIEWLNMPIEADTKNPCLGCPSVKEGVWRTDRRIRQLSIAFRSICNFKCSYCNATLGTFDGLFETTEEMLIFLRFAKENNIIEDNTVIRFESGEISIHPLKNKILTELQDNPCWIFSNLGTYDKEIGKFISKSKNRLYPSIDAGTRQTFAKIKGVDVFDKVCDNLAKYSMNGLVHLKYIFLPDVNDNDADVDGFIDLCERLNIKQVDIVRDVTNIIAFSVHTINAIARMQDGLHRLGVDTSGSKWALSAIPNDWARIEEKLGELEQARCAHRPWGG